MCHQYNPTEIVYFDTFKTYNEELYALEFPDEWMKDHKEGTGPACQNCVAYATWRGVFIGYCANCAKDYQGFSRGIGFCGKAVECEVKDRPKEKSAYKTYLKGVSLNQIGDIEFNPSHTIDAHYEWWENIHDGCSDYKTNEAYVGRNHIVEEGGSVRHELETNMEIQLGDTIEYVSNNQMGWMKYKVIMGNGELDLQLIDSYVLRESFLLDL